MSVFLNHALERNCTLVKARLLSRTVNLSKLESPTDVRKRACAETRTRDEPDYQGMGFLNPRT